MTKQEFKLALEIAISDRDLSHIKNNHILGYGLKDFVPVHMSLEMVAKEIRYHAMSFASELDGNAVNEVATYGKRSFIII